MNLDDSDIGQDENDSDFLEGLKDLGLIDDEDFAKESAKSTPKSAKSTPGKSPRSKSKSRRRPPSRRPAINLDDLLDGIDVPKEDPVTPAATPVSASTTQVPTYDLSISQVPVGRDYSVRVESNIKDYISVQLKALRDDFLVELERLLVDNDSVESTVSAFVGELKDSVRELLQVELGDIGGKTPRIVSAVESILPGFKEAIKAATGQSGQERAQELENINLAQVAVASFLPVMNSGLKGMNDDVNRDLDELRLAQAGLKKAVSRSNQQKKSLRKSEMELECAQVRQDIESQGLREMTEVMEALRRPFKDDNDEDFFQDESEENHGSKRLRYALAKLRKQAEVSTSEPVSKLRAFQRRLCDCRDEANSVREIAAFSHQKYVNAVAEALQNSMFQTMPPPSPNPRVSFVNMDRYEPEIQPEPEPYITPLISTVRRRLKKIQEQREADLQSSASFLQEVKRQEKARIRESALPY